MVNHNKKKKKPKPLFSVGVCYECGEGVKTFPWVPIESVFCPKCSRLQKGVILFPRIDLLKKMGIDAKVWGE